MIHSTPPPSTPTPLLSEFANDPEMAELIESFTCELPERVRAILAAAREGRVSDLKRLSHQLKGAAGGYGFPTLGEAAGRVEDGLRAASDPTAALNAIAADVRTLVELCTRASTGKH
jgi:HPt (histidine-containing phosphotransfer) domain-containing protein